MSWFTTDDGRKVNTEWFDEDERKKYEQIEKAQKEADELNGKEDTVISNNSKEGWQKILDSKDGDKIEIEEFSSITGKPTGKKIEYTLNNGEWSSKGYGSFKNDMSGFDTRKSIKGIIPKVNKVSDLRKPKRNMGNEDVINNLVYAINNSKYPDAKKVVNLVLDDIAIGDTISGETKTHKGHIHSISVTPREDGKFDVNTVTKGNPAKYSMSKDEAMEEFLYLPARSGGSKIYVNIKRKDNK